MRVRTFSARIYEWHSVELYTTDKRYSAEQSGAHACEARGLWHLMRHSVPSRDPVRGDESRAAFEGYPRASGPITEQTQDGIGIPGDTCSAAAIDYDGNFGILVRRPGVYPQVIRATKGSVPRPT